MNDLYPPGITPATEPLIRMPRALWEKWDAALRSGEYQQAPRKLCVFDDNGQALGYCCLGVLQMVADGGVERRVESGVSRSLPTTEWAVEHDVATRPDSDCNWEPSAVFFAGHYSNSHAVEVTALNDGYFTAPDYCDRTKASFEQIADLVKAAVEFNEGGRP